MNQSISYSHTQSGTLIIVIILIAFVTIIIPVSILNGLTLLLIMLVVFGFIMYMFASLTVQVRHDQLKFWFGPGLIRKSFDIRDIVSAESVKNPWYYGWGIRITPRGWLYNVSGSYAVELTLKSGKHIRIGSDEPETLARVIHQAIENHTIAHT